MRSLVGQVGHAAPGPEGPGGGGEERSGGPAVRCVHCGGVKAPDAPCPKCHKRTVGA